MTVWTTDDRSTRELLDRMRRKGDEHADETVELLVDRDVQAGRQTTMRGLANRLMGFEDAEDADRAIRLLLTERPRTAEAIDPRQCLTDCRCTDELARPGQRLFEEHGLKILMILVFYSLPAAYSAQKGVQVLNSRSGGTGFLVSDLNRRLIETGQFVIDVLTPRGLYIAPGGSLKDHGPAVRSALRVRLLHATVRSLIREHKTFPEDALGTPVNQEDMAGTLLTFSWLIIDGLRQLGLRVDRETEEAYFGVWRQVGALMGVSKDLIPANVAEAECLMGLIKERQIDAPIRDGRENEDGQQMTASLLEFTRQALPFPLRFRRLPASVMRFFLPRAPEDVATSLGVPRTYVLDEIVRFWFYFEATVTRFRFFDALNKTVFKEWGGRDTRVASLLQFSRFFNKRLVQALARVDRNQMLGSIPAADRRRRDKVDLRDMDKTWRFDQADFLTRGARQARNWVTRR